MRYTYQIRKLLLCTGIRKQNITSDAAKSSWRCKDINRNIHKLFHTTTQVQDVEHTPKPLRRLKPRSQLHDGQFFLDMKYIRAIGGKGGDGEISLLRLWVNDRAGPDGGDGGNGGHVILEVTQHVKDLKHISRVLKAENGEKGQTKSCFGKNADHTIVHVPLGTIVRDIDGSILADLDEEGMMFIAARGGAGGHGNAFFKSNLNQTPKICEYGADGETAQYILEVRSMAHVGLIGFPNAGKSTLLRAISRARPKVAPYAFTTLKPHVGMVLYDDYEQIAVADLPGLIADSHKNAGLGISFLKHAERCAALLFVVDLSAEEPWDHFNTLRFEMSQFNDKLNKRPHLIIANKIDLPSAAENLEKLKRKVDLPVIPISAKMGTNVSLLLREIRRLYDDIKESASDSEQSPM